MAELQIKPGTKLKVAFDTAVGQKTEFNMMATFKGVIDEAYFLISAPMLAGKPLILDENQKFLLQYTLGENTFMLAGYPESVEKARVANLLLRLRFQVLKRLTLQYRLPTRQTLPYRSQLLASLVLFLEPSRVRSH